MGAITRVCGCLVLASILLPTLASAASVSYYLNQSNQLPDGTNYLEVTVTDSGNPAGPLDFTVQTLAPLSTVSGSNFGIQSFGVGVKPGVSTAGVKVTSLPAGWNVRPYLKMSQFGTFDVGLFGHGYSRMDPLTFQVTGLSLTDLEPFFAAHVAGFDWVSGVGGAQGSGVDGWGSPGGGISSAFFAGAADPAPVPLPAALWLMLGGLGALGAFARRGARARRELAA